MRAAYVIRVLRPAPAAIAGLAAGGAAWAVARVHLPEAVALALPVMIAAMLGFALNDIYDIHKDRRAGRTDKPLATGELPVAPVVAVILAYFCVGAAVAVLAAGAEGLVAYLAVCLLVYIYSPFAKAFPSLKGVYTSALCLSPYAFVQIATGARVSALMYVTAFSFFVFREIAIDASEIDWDMRASYRTFPVIAGRRLATLAGWTGMFVVAIAVCALAVGTLEKIAAVAILAGLAGANLVFLRSPLLGIDLTRLPLLIASVTLPFILAA